MKLLIGGALLTGVGVVAYVLLNRKETTPTTPTPAPAPINPVAQMPAASASSDVIMACAQVVTECADGSWAPTPCDCQNRGGIARKVVEPASDVFVDEPDPPAIDPEVNQRQLAMKEEIKKSLGSLVLTRFANG
jgi:hypothetical protein